MAFQSKADHPPTQLYSCNIDLDPMTLRHELDLETKKCTCMPKMSFLGQRFQ